MIYFSFGLFIVALISNIVLFRFVKNYYYTVFIPAQTIPKKVFQKIALIGYGFTVSPMDFQVKTFSRCLKKYGTGNYQILQFDLSQQTESIPDIMYQVIAEQSDAIVITNSALIEPITLFMKQRDIFIPIVVFCCQTHRFEKPLEKWRSKTIQITGTLYDFDWKKYITVIKKSLPSVKNVLTVYNNVDELTHGDLKDINSLAHALRLHKVQSHMHHIDTKAPFTIPKEKLTNIDLIILPNSVKIMALIQQIADFGAKHDIPIASCDTSYVKSGVLIAISSNNSIDMGSEAAKQVLAILDGTPANSLAIKHHVNNICMKANLQHANKKAVHEIIAHCPEFASPTISVMFGGQED